MQKRIYIIGYGDVGARIAPLALESGVELHTVSRTNKRVIDHDRFIHHTIDLDDMENIDPFIQSDSDIIYLAPPNSQGAEETRIGKFFTHLSRSNIKPRRIVYISATGVYGDCKGEWITEETPLSPNVDRSRRRVDAEQRLQNWCKENHCEWIILRVAGIYGPGKLPIDRLEQGITVLKEEIAPASNRIHIDDLAQISLAALESPSSNEIYNVADESPTTMTDYFTRVARVFNLPEPRQVSWEEAQKTMSPQMLSYLSESKKIDISKLKSKLGVKLWFPDLASGLNQCKEELEKPE